MTTRQLKAVAEAIYDCTSFYGVSFQHAPESVCDDYMRHAKAVIEAMQVREMTTEEVAYLLTYMLEAEDIPINTRAQMTAQALAKLGTIRIVEK